MTPYGTSRQLVSVHNAVQHRALSNVMQGATLACRNYYSGYADRISAHMSRTRQLSCCCGCRTMARGQVCCISSASPCYSVEMQTVTVIRECSEAGSALVCSVAGRTVKVQKALRVKPEGEALWKSSRAKNNGNGCGQRMIDKLAGQACGQRLMVLAGWICVCRPGFGTGLPWSQYNRF